MCYSRIMMALIVALVCCVVFVEPSKALDGPSVVINELMWMGSSASSSDEWIELKNMTSEPVSLSEWKLTKRSSGQEVAMLTVPDGLVIPPNGLFLIAHFAHGSASTQLEVTPNLVDSHVSLLNSGLQIKLYDAAGSVMDVADDGVGTPLAGKYESGKTYASMARNGVPGDGTKLESWHTSTTAIGFKVGSIPLGTPGASNDNVPPTVAAIPDQTVTIGSQVTFDATDAIDPDGSAMVYSWDFGDGVTSDVVAPVHAYSVAGTFHGSLTVSDGTSASVVSFVITVTVMPVVVSAPSATPGFVSSGTVVISELLPNPSTAQSEYVELIAPDADVDISDWTLIDKGGTVYVFPKGTVVTRSSSLVIDRATSKIVLNNDGDVITLKRLDGTVADEVTYGAADKGSSYARDGDVWAWTITPTPGAANVIKKLNHAPKAAFTCASRKRVNEKVDCTAADSEDQDGDVLTYAWDFGDGVTSKDVIVNHAFTKDGTFLVRLTVKDLEGFSDIEEKNVIIKPALVTASTKKTNSAVNAKVAGAAVVTTIADTKDASSGTTVELKGWVCSVPGTLGQNMFYLSDGSTGITVRSTVTVPKLNIGDAVKVSGERRTQSGEAYVRVTDKSSIVATGAPRQLTPVATQASAIDSDLIGALVKVSGGITSLSGGRFTIDDGTGEASVYIKTTTGFTKPALHVGDTVTVGGIVSMTSSGIRILPRIKDDIRIEVPAVAPTGDVVIVPTVRKPSWWMYALVAGGVLLGVGFGMWRKQNVPTT